MNSTSRISRTHALLLSLALGGLVSACGSGDNSSANANQSGFTGSGPAGDSPTLGTAGPYGVFASNAAVSIAAAAQVIGDVGLNPVGACNNCVIGVTVIGTIHNGDAAAIQAQTDFGAAYTDAANRSTNACAIVDGELSHAQASCAGVTSDRKSVV